MHTYIHQLFSKVIFETKLNFSKKELNKFISDFKKFSLKNISDVDIKKLQNIYFDVAKEYLFTNKRKTCEPINPAPPVIKIVFLVINKYFLI